MTLLAALAGCAARGPTAQGNARQARADGLVNVGCHACLAEALDEYEHLLATPRVDRPGVTRAAFDTAILLAFRSKELGLPADAAIERAERLGALLPGHRDVRPLVATARLWPGEVSGFDNEVRQARQMEYWREQNSEARPARRALDGVPTSLALSYAALALDCDARVARDGIDPDAVLAALGDRPVLRFRLALCSRDSRDLLATLEGTDPRWVPEVAFVRGRAMTADPRQVRDGVRQLETAAAAFPESGAIRLALAGGQRALRELDAALASYDAVLALAPTQRDALLGRVICLTYLKRPQEAIEAATRMVDLGTWLIGDALYWRAWNQYQLKSMDRAWEDVERATALFNNTNVYTLGGLVAYARRDLDAARDRFERAWKMDAANCDALSYLGIVRAEQEAWPVAAEVFTSAMACATTAAEKAARDLAALERSDQPQEFKERQAAEYHTVMSDAEAQAATAAYNAGNAFARAGHRDLALARLEVAARHPSMTAKADALRALLAAR